MKKSWMLSVVVACAALAVPQLAWGDCSGSVSAPSQATGVTPDGNNHYIYTSNTFSTTSFSSSNVDTAYNFGGAYCWFPWRFAGLYGSADENQIGFDANNDLVLNGDFTGPNGEVSTATQRIDQPGGFAGIAFGGGGYFEADVLFSPGTVPHTSGHPTVNEGWPSFWGMAVEHLAPWPQNPATLPASDHWVNYSADNSFMDYAEADFFEYDTALQQGQQNYITTYGGTIHEWWGDPISGGTTAQDNVDNNIPSGAPSGFQNGNSNYYINMPGSTNFSISHKYGFLWVPATASSEGMAQWYLDGVLQSTVTWQEYTNQGPPPVSNCSAPYTSYASPACSFTNWLFGIIDQQHLALALGTGVGASGGANPEVMTVKSVNVWQTNADQNLSASVSPCTFSLGSPTPAGPYSRQQQTVSFTVTSGCAWKVVSSASWLTVIDPDNPANGESSGNDTVYLNLNANLGSQRTATVTLYGQTVTITQNGLL